MKTKTFHLFLSGLICWSLMIGCGGRFGEFAPTHFESSFFYSADVQNITILPAVDLRMDKSLEFPGRWPEKAFLTGSYDKFDAIIPTNYLITHKGWDVTLAKNFGGVNNISEDDVVDAQQSWVKKLGPDESKWVLLFVLEDLAVSSSFGKSSFCECSGFLYEKAIGKNVWRQEQIGEVGMGGAVGLMTSDEDIAIMALKSCFVQTILQFPNRKQGGDANGFVRPWRSWNELK